MGTINYRTSDYITLGLNPVSGYDLEKDKEIIEAAKENAIENDIEYDNDFLEGYARDEAYIINETDYYNAKYVFEKYSFYYFHITMESGYYEGFSFNIEPNFGLCYDNYLEKREAQKEVTEIKKMMMELAGIGVVSVYPGWCTGYADYEGTIQDINKAIKEMRSDIKMTPTYNQYMRESA